MVEEAGYDELLLAAKQLIWLGVVTPVDALCILVILLMDVKVFTLGSGIESLIEGAVRDEFSWLQCCVDVREDVCLLFGEVGIIPFEDNII